MKPEYTLPLIHGDDNMADYWHREGPKPSIFQEIRDYWEDNHDFRNHTHMVVLAVLTFIAGVVVGMLA